MNEALTLWTIYNHPTDAPEPFGYAVREWHVGDEGGPHATSQVLFAMTLEDARALVPPGLFRLERDPNDDPVIVETWL